jgi:hypothetical protein
MRLGSLSTVVERVACMALCATALTGTAHASTSTAVESASQQERPVYFNGKVVEMKYSTGKRDSKIGPWNIFAHVLHDKPRDPHPNLYIVAPGTQYTSAVAGQFDHNEVISTLPLKPDPVEWDVYYAVVLDPSLQEDFRSEQQLILATQKEFEPGENFTIAEIPGAVFLKKYLGIDSVQSLAPYRRSGGKLPRIIIVPAKLCVKASVIDAENPPEATPKNSQTPDGSVAVSR